ncbi:MAG: ATP-dependent Clp protease ATP-binding subunit [Patescibacteria group bacterium]|jgi:ATP-dependent Clp protease ATP-binding subunit ClpC
MRPNILNKFSAHLKRTLDASSRFALELGCSSIEPLYLLYGLAESKGGVAYEILRRSGLKTDHLKTFIELRHKKPAIKQDQLSVDDLTFSPAAKKALERSVLTANQFKHKYVGTEHLMNALFELSDPEIKEFFTEANFRLSEANRQLLMVLKSTSKFPELTNFFDTPAESAGGGALPMGTEPDFVGREQQTQALEYFAQDLTTKEAQKNIDPVIGRGKEIERLVHILSRRTKNNPVLIGDPGVGKTAIVEGLAKKIMEGDVPDELANKRILALDLALMVAGTIYRGEFESRLKQVLDEIKADPNIVLFIDEIHTIVGTGSASGSMDAANILKPALAKGHVRCIGATTLDEYRKNIESDAALERRFQPIIIDEPTTIEAIAILQGIKHNYEKYHRVHITDEAIESAVKLSQRYVQDKFLPDKAIDLIDEAASKRKVEHQPKGLQREIRALEEEVTVLEEQKMHAVHEGQFEKALAYKERGAGLGSKLEGMKERQEKEHAASSGTITEKDIATIISRMTGVPVEDLLKEEKNRLLNIEKLLKNRIVGQDPAIKAIANAIRRSRVGLAHPKKPIASFIFLGPSGVGKTETAKALAELVFEDPNALIRIDMSEFQESFTVSKLIGAPAGYVGYKDGNKLTEAVRRKPYSVVLLDEIEKAHPDIFNVFLQVLDNGVLTDGSGKEVNFSNTIIIMTSNIGMKSLNEAQALGFDTETGNEEQAAEKHYEKIETEVLAQLKQEFLPEFLNRVDHTIVYRPLDKKTLTKIVDLQIKELSARLAEQALKIQIDAKAKHYIIQESFSPDQGARAIRKVIQDKIENPLAEQMLTGAIPPGTTVKVTTKGDGLEVKKAG